MGKGKASARRHARGMSAGFHSMRLRQLRAAILSILVMLGFIAPLRAQPDPCAPLNSAERLVYGGPSLHAAGQRTGNSTQNVARLRAAAKQLGPEAVPCFQEMLVRQNQPPPFLLDGSTLLLSLDTSAPSLAAISAALRAADLKAVDPAAYVSLLLRLSRRGVDIGPLAEKYMKSPPDAASISPGNSHALHRIDNAMLLYGSMEPELAAKYLALLAQGDDSRARPAAVFALALNLTEPAFETLHAGLSLDGLSDKDEEIVRSVLRYTPVPDVPHTPLSRARVLRRLAAVIHGDFGHIDPANPPYVAGDQAFDVSAGAQLTPADLPELMEARRKSVRSISDDSLDEYVALTRTILIVINRFDLYMKWREHPRPGASQP